MLTTFFVTLELLYKRYCRNGPQVNGVLLENEEVTKLMSGDTHPLKIIGRSRSMWWEDLWDEQQADKLSYWPGCAELYHNINDAISRKSYLLEIRQHIRGGKLERPEDAI